MHAIKLHRPNKTNYRLERFALMKKVDWEEEEIMTIFPSNMI
jgi:hypothetical protein